MSGFERKDVFPAISTYCDRVLKDNGHTRKFPQPVVEYLKILVNQPRLISTYCVFITHIFNELKTTNEYFEDVKIVKEKLDYFEKLIYEIIILLTVK